MDAFSRLRIVGLAATLMVAGACVQILGDDFEVAPGTTGSAGTPNGGNGGSGGDVVTSSGGEAGSVSSGGTGGAGAGGMAGAGGVGGTMPACGAPGELCCSSGPPCQTLTCANGLCPEITTLIQVVKPAPYTGTYGIDETEVTRKQYEDWLATNPVNSGALVGPGCGNNTSFIPPASCMSGAGVCSGAACGNHPQVCVDWCDAFAYCAAVGKKLCQHVESGFNSNTLDETNAWYNVCSSGGMHTHSPGTNAGDCRTGSWGSTHEVKAQLTCQSSETGYEGVFDLTGNAMEWVYLCDSPNAEDALCNTLGGHFHSDPPFEQCNYPEELERNQLSQWVGFRCCEL